MKTSFSRLSTAALGVMFAFASAGLAADQPYVGLAKQLVGHYDGVAGPGNKLRVTVQGTYNGSNVRFDGFLTLEPQGDSVRLIWLMRRGNECQVDIHTEGDDFVGVTLPGTCQTAFQNPISGKWEFQTEPGSK